MPEPDYKRLRKTWILMFYAYYLPWMLGGVLYPFLVITSNSIDQYTTITMLIGVPATWIPALLATLAIWRDKQEELAKKRHHEEHHTKKKHH